MLDFSLTFNIKVIRGPATHNKSFYQVKLATHLLCKVTPDLPRVVIPSDIARVFDASTPNPRVNTV